VKGCGCLMGERQLVYMGFHTAFRPSFVSYRLYAIKYQCVHQGTIKTNGLVKVSFKMTPSGSTEALLEFNFVL
jgi:hypothetical protein